METDPAVMVNVALVKPALIVTEVGTVRLVLDDVSGIVVADCAGLPRLNVHVLEPGVCIVAGVQTRFGLLDAAVILSAAMRVMAPAVAVIVALPVALADAAAVKLADKAPMGTMTEAGTPTCALLLLSAMLTPP